MEIKLNHHLCRTRDEVLAVATPAVADFLDEWYSSSDFVCGHTSGSTGTPKSVKLLKQDMEVSARLTNNFFSIDYRSILLLCLSPDYIAGKMMLVRALLSGADLLVVPPSSQPLATIDEPIDFAAMVPAQVIETLASVEQTARLARVKTLIIGGASLAFDTEAQLKELPVISYVTYGMTETVSHVALRRLGDPAGGYRAMNGITFSTDDRECLVIHAPHFSTQKFITNDIVRLDNPSTFRWIGRYDNVINTGGVKVFPEQVEQKIASLLNPRRFFITALPDTKWGECVTLVIEGESLTEKDEVALLATIRKQVTRYEYPRRILYLLHFKETSSGKVIRAIE